jgi:hypothetical protein
MPSRRITFSESRWPDTPEFGVVARRWNDHAISLLLGYVWQGYDRLSASALRNVDWDTAIDDIERDITQHLESHIQDAMSGFEPFRVQHGPYERESRGAPPAQPPQYDIAFVLRANPRIMWPLEAKVLHTDQQLADYVSRGCDRFLTCYYAPFSSGAAMLGYLFGGRAESFLKGIAERLKCALESHPDFIGRAHRVSKHIRNVPPGKLYPRHFSCHHLVMPFKVEDALPDRPG